MKPEILQLLDDYPYWCPYGSRIYGTETFASLWARMVVYGAKLNGINDAKYELTHNNIPSFCVGGYGLFD